mmetsp:Transcript_32412/g.82261  ORF Transcript_32412/g.82261 Transcript_32412/m.82261 type:complete len:373 (+) Transcript_32412:1226-2344(+)
MALAAEAMPPRAGEVREVVAVVEEHLLLAPWLTALVDVGVVPGEELVKLDVCLLREALLKYVDELLRSKVESASVRRASQLVQPPFAHDDVEVVLQGLETEPVLARQRAAALHFVRHQADRTIEHGPVLLVLPLQIVYELPVALVHVPHAALRGHEVCRADDAAQVFLFEVGSALGDLRGATDVGQPAESRDPFRPETLEASDMHLVATMQSLQYAVLAEADDARNAQGGAQVARARQLSHRLRDAGHAPRHRQKLGRVLRASPAVQLQARRGQRQRDHGRRHGRPKLLGVWKPRDLLHDAGLAGDDLALRQQAARVFLHEGGAQGLIVQVAADFLGGPALHLRILRQASRMVGASATCNGRRPSLHADATL